MQQETGDGPAAACFDLDGVLWDTSAVHAAAYSTVCAADGLAPLSYDLLAGRPTVEGFRLIMADNGRPAERGMLERLVRDKQEVARATLAAAPPITPGIAALQLIGDAGLPTALVTGSSAQTVEVFLRAIRDVHTFSAVITAEAPGLGKPSPEPYLHAATSLGLAPQVCWALEDSLAGLASARRAGMHAVELRVPRELGDEAELSGEAYVCSVDAFVKEFLDSVRAAGAAWAPLRTS